MAKLTLTDVINLQNEQTARGVINANSALIETALENTLSRDGTTPNTMASNLDMNSNRIINLPEPVNGTEPVRLTDVDIATIAQLQEILADAEAAQAAAEVAQAAAELAETNAETAETNAETAEANAETAEANAEAAQAAAELAQAAAETAQTAAELAETNAETAETNAEAAQVAAEAARAGAETAETNAETAETNAESAQTAAEAAQTAAEAALAATLIAADNFDDVYLGSKASDPTLDNDGNALVEGQLYWNSSTNALQVYDGAAWNAYSAASGITAVVDDTSPQLGGDLDLNTFDIIGHVIGTDIQAFDADTLKADVDDSLTAGYDTTAVNDGTKSSGTYTPVYTGGNIKRAVNGGAHTLAPQGTDGVILIQYTNNGSAGTITTSGFTKVDGAFTTVNGDDFICTLTRINNFTHLNIVRMQ